MLVVDRSTVNHVGSVGGVTSPGAAVAADGAAVVADGAAVVADGAAVVADGAADAPQPSVDMTRSLRAERLPAASNASTAIRWLAPHASDENT